MGTSRIKYISHTAIGSLAIPLAKVSVAINMKTEQINTAYDRAEFY